MINEKWYDIAIIGGGIIGMATAMELMSRPGLSLIVLEAEDRIAAHQTGNNSGVIHSGLYYKPGSLKARNCVEGREALYRFCKEYGIAHQRCGKVVVATHKRELPILEELERRGLANGLQGLRRLSPEEIREYEPHVVGIAGLLVQETGIVDYVQVTHKFADLVRAAGGEIQTRAKVYGVRRQPQGLLLETLRGEVRCRYLINCAGLQSDRVARMCGVNPHLQIIPFRGEYYELVPQRRYLIKNLVYPVPDPAFPFLGVHFTRMIHGGVEAGPNAVLAFKREGYRLTSFSLKDMLETVTYIGFWQMARRYWKTGIVELSRSLNKKAFVKALQKLVPELRPEDIRPAGAGVRAQAVEPNGLLVDDFRIVEAERMIHVLNAPSPAATASISIGKTIARMAEKNFDLPNVK
ncbi:MAG TPA: L-2-hydroxyglutarate oxidase [Candidatus Limnocylindrales bacterium]|nr:L-2-hydroxyglutarate oxidase [Candidatus Limnocylindrales bacterium]